MSSETKKIKNLFLAIAQLPREQWPDALARECVNQPELNKRLQTLLAGFDSPFGPFAFPASPQEDSQSEESESAVTGEYQNQKRVFSTNPVPNNQNRAVFEAGTIIGGRYTLLNKIGEGGMGEVWIAKQTEPIKRKVAVKLIKTGMDSKMVLARFGQERQALGMMDHPNIAQVLDGGMSGTGQPFFVMELVDGISLTNFCDQNKLTTRERLELFVPICQAVQHAHQKGIVHRDLKPANILVEVIDGRPVPKVIDFGVAKATGGKLSDEMLSTIFGSVVGTLEYMSPEQAGFSPMDVDTRADIYSLGVILYELLTGLRPIDAQRLKKAAGAEVIRMIQEVEPPRPSTRLSTDESLPSLAALRQTEPKKLMALLRGELDWVVMKCLEKQRERRYPTANGLVRDIQRYLADEPVEAKPPSFGYRFGKFLRRNRGPVFAAGLVALSLFGGIIGTTWGLLEAMKQTGIAQGETAKKEDARRLEAEQRVAAEQANQQAYLALKSFTDDLMEKVLGGRSELTEDEKSILLNAQKQWEVFASSKGDSAEARAIRADGAVNLSLLQSKLGFIGDSIANERTALKIREELVRDFPGVPLYREKLASIYQNLGGNLRASGQREEAEASFVKAVNTYEKLVADFPIDPFYRNRMAQSLVSLGNAKRARKAWPEAEKHYRDAQDIQNLLTKQYPQKTGYRWDLANTHWGLAVVMKRLEKNDSSVIEYRKALEIMEDLERQFPKDSNYQIQTANLNRELGVTLYDDGKLATGAEFFPKAIDTFQKLAAQYPSIPQHRVELVRCRRDYGKVLGLLKKPKEARDQFDQAILLAEKLVADQPTVLPNKVHLGLTCSFFGQMLLDGDHPDESLPLFEKAVKLLGEAYFQDTKEILTKNALDKAYGAQGEALEKLNRHDEAVKAFDKAIDLNPEERVWPYRAQRAYSQAKGGQFAKAISEMLEVTRAEPKDPEHWYNFARVYALASTKEETRKEEYAKLVIDQLGKAVNAGFKKPGRLKKDPDLAPIQGHKDFQTLLTDLEKKFPSAPESKDRNAP